MSLSVVLNQQSEKYPDQVFLRFERQPSEERPDSFVTTLTYAKFNALVNQTANYLQALGLTKGDVFNVHLPNCVTFLALWFAGAHIGAVMMPTNVLASPDELSYLFDHSECKVSFCIQDQLQTVVQSQADCPMLANVILCDPYSHSPALDSLERRVSQCPTSESKNNINDYDLAAIMYTSGTTSKPKGVMVTHANYIKAGDTVADAIRLTARDRQFVVMPLFHGNAQYYSTMSALLRGASIALMDRFSASQFMQKCFEHQCTVASLFAAPMRMILAQPEKASDNQNLLRLVMYAQSITQQQMDDWQRRYAAPLAQLWGMTETMGPPLMNPYDEERRNLSIGKPIGGYEIRLIDDAGKDVEVGETGEILVKGEPGKTIMQGYFKNPQATEDTIKDGYLYTGDNARQDAQGYYHFVDRAKDMIKRSGENVAATEVESAVLQHLSVFDCAVIGLPDELRDEQIVAVVVLNEDCQLSEQELIDFCASKLASFRVPNRIVFQDQLPRTSVGKIQKNLIRNQLIEQC
ncbi:class I adenylate-forming enzyme family protein [Pseudomonadota bacterium]